MTATIREAQVPSGQFLSTDWGKLLAIREADALLESLAPHFAVETLSKDAALNGEEVLLIRGRQRSYLVRTQTPPIVDDTIPLWLVLENQKIKPLELDTFRESVADGRVHRLNTRPITEQPPPATDQNNSANDRESQSHGSNSTSTEEVAEPMELTEAQIAERDQILDMGAFSQLVEAAQRCGIVPGVSAIIQVRDSEFRRGRYQQSLQTMESLFSSFSGNAMQRQQRLMREDADIACGRIKMSPRELQAKRVRDNQANDAIERARTRFSRVLDGLRLLLHNQEHSKT